MKIRSMIPALLALMLPVLSCADKKPEYKVSEQEPAGYITAQRSGDDEVSYGESACAIPAPFVGGAYEYLEVLVNTGGRRSGTQGYRCAAAFARGLLASFGYDVLLTSYSFPYHDFSLADIKVTRPRDGANFPAYPMHYSARLEGVKQGRLVRPRPGRLEGCFVYLDPHYHPSKDLKEKYVEWKERGALGVIREAGMKPPAAKGLRHSSRAHATSWHYAPLPGFVVEKAHELVGETIEVSGEARIVRGTGYNVAAKSPVESASCVLVTAHLDCWFTGALDDGSGSAALLEAARLLKDDPRGIIFLLADSEEIGLIGSSAYIQQAGFENLSAVIELDMVSTKFNYGRGAKPEGASIMPRIITVTSGLFPLVKQNLGEMGGTNLYVPVAANDLLFDGFATDMEWFYAAGVPGAFIYTPSNFYHTERDTMEWIPADDLEGVAAAVADLARDLRDAGPLERPSRVVGFDFTAAMTEGDSISFEVRPGAGLLSFPRPRVAVNAYFEHGFEDRTELERGDDGVYRGKFCPSWPGEWEFLANVSQSNKRGKRWAVLMVPDRVKRREPWNKKSE